MAFRSVLIPVNICTLILLQTDSSPSMSLAQLAKVVSLEILCHPTGGLQFIQFPFYWRVDIIFSPPLDYVCQTPNLVDANASEEDKIKAMISQSIHDYDPIQLVYLHPFIKELLSHYLQNHLLLSICF